MNFRNSSKLSNLFVVSVALVLVTYGLTKLDHRKYAPPNIQTITEMWLESTQLQLEFGTQVTNIKYSSHNLRKILASGYLLKCLNYTSTSHYTNDLWQINGLAIFKDPRSNSIFPIYVQSMYLIESDSYSLLFTRLGATTSNSNKLFNITKGQGKCNQHEVLQLASSSSLFKDTFGDSAYLYPMLDHAFQQTADTNNQTIQKGKQ